MARSERGVSYADVRDGPVAAAFERDVVVAIRKIDPVDLDVRGAGNVQAVGIVGEGGVGVIGRRGNDMDLRNGRPSSAEAHRLEQEFFHAGRRR